MNKNALRTYAIWARNELIAQVKQRAYQYGMREKGCDDENAQAIAGRALTPAEQQQRTVFILKIRKHGYQKAVEDVAYTWFNRFIALRYMEVNDYLPTHIRVFSDAAGDFHPEILKNVLHLELEGLDQKKVSELLNANKSEELYKYLLLTQCNALHAPLPAMFEKLGSYTELLLPNHILKAESVIGRLVRDIAEEDWKDVQIIGWMYQYYNTEPKQVVFEQLKKNVKITKENIPVATQLFTPDWIVRYMVENSLGRRWLESHPNDTVKANWTYYLDEAEQTPEVTAQLRMLRSQSPVQSPEDIRLIDPCMGSGHILVYAFDVLMQLYESVGVSPRDAAKLILEKNIYGLDIDRRAYQLAYFALMMKARQYNRRIFTVDVKPHVYCPTGFADGEEYGALVQVDALEPMPVQKTGQLSIEDISYDDELNAWNFKRLLAQQYDVVVTNPPYMGSDNMSAKLKTFLSNNYYDERYDIYAAFVSRCLRMKTEDGYVSIITQNSFLYALCFSRFRNTLLNNTRIVNAIHLGPRAFEDISGEVVQTIATVFCRQIKNYRSSIKRLVECMDNKEKAFFNEKPYLFDPELFEKLPNNVFAYSISPEMKNLCIDEQKIGDLFISKAGVVTGNDDYFLRYWHEIRFAEFDLNGIDTASKYVPFSKGGSFVKWYGNIVYAIKLADLWTDSKVNKSVRRGDTSAYFKRAIGWSYMGGGNKKNFSLLNGCVCGTGTPTILNENDDQFFYVLGFLNTKIPQRFIELFNPTLNTYASDICNLPLVLNIERSDIVNKVNRCIGIAQNDWDSFETSWDFTRHPLVRGERTIAAAFSHYQREVAERFDTLKSNEEQLNRIFIDIYGLQDELTPDVADKDVTVHRLYERDEDIPASMKGSKYVLLQQDVIASFISYAIGCMFGRYSLDCEGLVYAGGAWDASQYQTFPADLDNVLPICDDAYFDDDLVGRFVVFVKTVYGADTLEENLHFIADALGGKGTPREVIRHYFLNGFYKNHVTIYQKRPIYWLFDSGKKHGFKALVYLHRISRDLLAKLRTDYVHEQQERYRTQLAHIATALDTATDSERARLLKQQNKLSEQLKEITIFEEKVHHLADQNIEIDLDDGVKNNYALFPDILAKI